MIKRKSIYIASKTKHSEKWLALRSKGVNIISTWIDEAGEGQSKDLEDLQHRCIKECIICDGLIVYAEEGDILKGAFIEMGIAIANPNKPIYLVGEVLKEKSVFTHSPNVRKASSVEEAIELINGGFYLPISSQNPNPKNPTG